MKTQLCQKLVVLFLISVFVSGCNIGTKKTTDNDVTFDSISVDISPPGKPGKSEL